MPVTLTSKSDFLGKKVRNVEKINFISSRASLSMHSCVFLWNIISCNLIFLIQHTSTVMCTCVIIDIASVHCQLCTTVAFSSQFVGVFLTSWTDRSSHTYKTMFMCRKRKKNPSPPKPILKSHDTDSSIQIFCGGWGSCVLIDSNLTWNNNFNLNISNFSQHIGSWLMLFGLNIQKLI